MRIPTTVDIQVVGPYRGPHISGASDNLDEVRFSRLYQFETFGLRITHIPAKRDDATGRMYVSAPIAKRVHAKVREIEEIMKRVRTDAGGALSIIRPNFSVNASEFLSDAA